MENFADRLIAAIEEKGSPACVGIDPRPELIPAEITKHSRQRGEAGARVAAVLAFSREILEIVAGHVAVVKPQVAFYEALGAAGLMAYAETVRAAGKRGLLVIGDVKRSDIGSTAQAYAASHLRELPNGDEVGAFTADAVTVNPYLGSDGVEPFIEAAAEEGRGVFVLVKTSNPSSAEFQDLKVEGGRELFVEVADKVNEWGGGLIGERGYSAVGAVVGATYPEQASRLRTIMPKAYFLVPGYGAQGGSAKDTAPCFNNDGLGAVVNSSRGIIYAWTRPPYKEQYGERRWREAVEAAAKDMAADLSEM
ncbi:MAG: orotidine-5'-phosphate decarboxylase [Planctomycetes bacterium]|nr:orotidine-5'-phosphate decarboxylase [Planctomycetota bacterium]